MAQIVVRHRSSRPRLQSDIEKRCWLLLLTRQGPDCRLQSDIELLLLLSLKVSWFFERTPRVRRISFEGLTFEANNMAFQGLQSAVVPLNQDLADSESLLWSLSREPHSPSSASISVLSLKGLFLDEYVRATRHAF